MSPQQVSYAVYCIVYIINSDAVGTASRKGGHGLEGMNPRGKYAGVCVLCVCSAGPGKLAGIMQVSNSQSRLVQKRVLGKTIIMSCLVFVSKQLAFCSN